MPTEDAVLFSAGHGFYHFAISQGIFDRSLYYNLLLQPRLAVPDHYLLQGEWVTEHMSQHKARDSWIEVGLRNGFVVPYFRSDTLKLATILASMVKSDRRGFGRHAEEIAERLDRTPFKPRHWSSTTNSHLFGRTLAHYLTASEPPILEMGTVDPDDFLGFWRRSRAWIAKELEMGETRSSARLGAQGMLISQLMQVTGERLLGPDCGKIPSIPSLLRRVKLARGPDEVRDLRAYYTLICELYNRSLADTLLTSHNSPRWQYYVAALDMWREQLRAGGSPLSIDGHQETEEFDVSIQLPKPAHLRHVSGDTLLTIRKSAACERYFESLATWRNNPSSSSLRGELVDTLRRYATEIVRQVGGSIGALGLHPRIISGTSDVMRLLERVPGIVHGLLAVGSAGGAIAGVTSPFVSAGSFSLLCLMTKAKYATSQQEVAVTVSPDVGVRVPGDVSISHA